MTVTTEATKWPEYLTVPEVADILRVSKMTVYRLVHRNAFDYPGEDGKTLPGAVRAGRAFRVPSAALDAYLRGPAVSA